MINALMQIPYRLHVICILQILRIFKDKPCPIVQNHDCPVALPIVRDYQIAHHTYFLYRKHVISNISQSYLNV